MAPASAAVTWRCPPRPLVSSPLPPPGCRVSGHGCAARRRARNHGATAAAVPSRTPADLREIRHALRADGPAAVLAIGTANPPHCVPQDEYVDWYFRVTNSDHLTNLKAKMKKICQNTGIKKRYFHHDDEMLRNHPEFVDGTLPPSIDARQEILAAVVPELAAAAAGNAIAEWGRPASDITHLVVATYSGAHMPGADLRVASLLGLRASAVRRTMLYFNGCYSGSAALRVAKDIAENNRGARVLVACAELSLVFFSGPDEARLDKAVVHALFGDGAGAVIVGADPDSTAAERPIFEMASASQATVPGTDHVFRGHIGEAGFDYALSSELPLLVGANIEQCLVDALRPLGLVSGPGAGWNWNWNGMFMAVHPGGRAVLDGVETALKLEPEKMAASRRVLREYGNMAGVSVIFVLDEMRRRREGEEWGVLVGLGPGITVETMVLRAPTAAGNRNQV